MWKNSSARIKKQKNIVPQNILSSVGGGQQLSYQILGKYATQHGLGAKNKSLRVFSIQNNMIKTTIYPVHNFLPVFNCRTNVSTYPNCESKWFTLLFTLLKKWCANRKRIKRILSSTRVIRGYFKFHFMQTIFIFVPFLKRAWRRNVI